MRRNATSAMAAASETADREELKNSPFFSKGEWPVAFDLSDNYYFSNYLGDVVIY